jgi:hypothetical protein
MLLQLGSGMLLLPPADMWLLLGDPSREIPVELLSRLIGLQPTVMTS